MAYTRAASGDANRNIEWTLTNPAGERFKASQGVNIFGNGGHYKTSFVACTHPDGKAWESLFIPANITGLNGISITWWNRRAGLPGQVNVKPCSETEFYDTVASKAANKGYDITSYIGLDRGLTRRHSFVEHLQATMKDSIAPCLSADQGASAEGALGSLVEGLLYLSPIDSFFARLDAHSCFSDTISQADSQAHLLPVRERNFMRNLIGRLGAHVFSGDDSAPTTSAPKAAPIKKTKEEIYTGWGAFG